MSTKLPDITCPHCKHKSNDEHFYMMSVMGGTVMYLPKLPLATGLAKVINFLSQTKTKQLFACPNCGISFIKVD